MFFDPSTFQCSPCSRNATAVDGVCQCDKGFAYVTDAATGSSACDSCSSRQQAVGSFRFANGSQICVPCGGDSQLGCLEDSHYDARLLQCVCPPGFLLVENIGPVILSAQMCVRCVNGNCSSCENPYVATSSGVCVCKSGYTLLYDGSCVPQLVYDSMANVARSTSTTLIPPNVGNSGRPGIAITQSNLRENAIGSAILCQKGNLTACNYLANLCVLMMYNSETTPCALYRHLQTNKKCGAQWCDSSLSLPPLYYNTSNRGVSPPPGKNFRFTGEENPIFIVSTYDLNGTWKGFHRLNDKVNLCRIPTPVLNNFFRPSRAHRVSCYLNWGWFFSTNHSEFHDVYMVDPSNEGNWIPVPLLIDYSNHEFDLQSRQSDLLYRSVAASGDAPSLDGFRRRFYVYADDSHIERYNNRELSYITTIWSVSLLFLSPSEGDHKFQSPLLVLQYASKNIAELSRLMDDPLHNSYLSEAYTPCCTLSVVQRVISPHRDHFTSTGIKVALIVLSIVCLVTSLIRTYGWMRRRQNHLLDGFALCRFFIYLFDHIGNTYFLIVCISSWYFYLLQRIRPRYDNVAGDSEVYIISMLYVVLGAKALTVLYYLVEQCNAYYFLIDWERPKGELLPEDKDVSLSMWRATFVANKLMELQMLRYWDPLQVMTIVLLFLGGLVYRTESSDDLSRYKTSYSVEVSDKTLRVAVATFFGLW
ncbi:unnamed protein product [Phytomonas sp. EM1]|nr:unnamed protein product [Phytomonas sp. EM1]|eukprot:CCW60186.1 unnamed protein product [Phytomonas sp. isolate EM1]